MISLAQAEKIIGADLTLEHDVIERKLNISQLKDSLIRDFSHHLHLQRVILNEYIILVVFRFQTIRIIYIQVGAFEWLILREDFYLLIIGYLVLLAILIH